MDMENNMAVRVRL